jgi:hypothetical protein
MAIPLSNRRRWLLVACVIFFGCGYLFLTGKEFVASWLAAHAELPKLERAVRLSPGNADYRHRLGRYFEFAAGDPASAIDSLQAAVALNPHDAHYWFDLAAAYQVTGDTAGQRSALDRALQAEPTAPDVAWEAANFFLIDGETDRALQEFHVVIENEVELAADALRACWQARPDADELLRDVVPARPDTLLAFATLLRGKQEVDGTIKTWERLSQLHQEFDRKYLYDYVDYLLENNRPEAAMAAWRDNAVTLGLTSYLPSEDNLVVNGDFSLDVLNGGFDWNYVTRNGVIAELDSTDFKQGHRSLSLSFEGPGISDAGFRQFIPVEPETTYEFSAYYKAADFEGVGGPEITLRDAYTRAPLYVSEPLRDADFWKEAYSKVTTPKTTTLLVLTIERSPAGSPIRGKLWLGDFTLALPPDPADSTDNSTFGPSSRPISPPNSNPNPTFKVKQ